MSPSRMILTEVEGKLIVTQMEIQQGGVLEGLELAVGSQVSSINAIPIKIQATGSKKRKAKEITDDKKRFKKEDMLQRIPWSAVFSFLGGGDVAKALMASKHQNPWKFVDVSAALKYRMMATEQGQVLLQQYYDNRPQFLPKLLHCMDHGYGIRYDGLYQSPVSGAFTTTVFFRFYPTGEVLARLTVLETLEQIWSMLQKEDDSIRKGTYECNFLPTGQNLFQVKTTFPDGLGNTWRHGPMGPNGELILHLVGCSFSRKFKFVKM